jgi:hypothetical protein
MNRLSGTLLIVGGTMASFGLKSAWGWLGCAITLVGAWILTDPKVDHS